MAREREVQTDARKGRDRAAKMADRVSQNRVPRNNGPLAAGLSSRNLGPFLLRGSVHIAHSSDFVSINECVFKMKRETEEEEEERLRREMEAWFD